MYLLTLWVRVLSGCVVGASGRTVKPRAERPYPWPWFVPASLGSQSVFLRSCGQTPSYWSWLAVSTALRASAGLLVEWSWHTEMLVVNGGH